MLKYYLPLFALLMGLQSGAQLNDCEPEFSSTLLAINNIRALIGIPNNFFTDRDPDGFEAGFEVPAGSGIHSVYAHTDWLGGTTADGQLYLAAGTYNNGGGSDFVSGPLSSDGLATTSPEVCEHYAELYPASRIDAMLHHEYFNRLEDIANGADPSMLEQAPFDAGYVIPEYFFDWPAQNPYPGYAEYLAPFYDRNQDGIYNPEEGDYPGFDLYYDGGSGSSYQYPLEGHEAIWQVHNDAGLHTETGGQPMGLEIHCTTYGFSTCDVLDNTLFQNKVFINRSSRTYFDTYIGQWVDTDLGCPIDDRVGCDVARGLGYTYNGDTNDEDCFGVPGYGTDVPILFFQIVEGPYQDADGIDNPKVYNVAEAQAQDGIVYAGQGIGYGDGIVDNERMKLRRFTYYTNGDTPGWIEINDEPHIAAEYYRYLSGRWKNDLILTYGGMGIDGDAPAQFMFPGMSDPLGFSTDGVIENGTWLDGTDGRPAGARKLLAITGPFTFDPGEVVDMTTAFNWTEGQNDPTLTQNAMRINSDVLQAHFEAAFQLVDALPVVETFSYTNDADEFTFSLPFYYDYDAHWDFGDGHTDQGLQVSHEYHEAGTYEVCVTVYNCSGATEICMPVTITALDLVELPSDEPILLYPNPVEDELFIHSSIIGYELSGVIIYDSSGKRVFKQRWEEGQESIHLPAGMKEGLYHLNAVYTNGYEYSKSFMKRGS